MWYKCGVSELKNQKKNKLLRFNIKSVVDKPFSSDAHFSPFFCGTRFPRTCHQKGNLIRNLDIEKRFVDTLI